ncbi:hypothetical protein GMRT_15606 [Giardia muris]|uniref:Uncharacterized protein n=1 Tax=Giardia muris TaxID=5742 RepID=A0A4Z1T491_GIAMU|nr:hypothetical protein GMRT_15606 [Giardia muris]|eukprot:TNJ28803.1 hypothetical protein GMRT_15606 [Giardia muris]
MEIPISIREEALAPDVQTNLVVLPQDVYLPMYSANIISEVEVYLNRYLLVFMAKSIGDGNRKAEVNFFVLEPEPDEAEVILGANFIYLKSTQKFEVRMERAIPYRIQDAYVYTHEVKPRKGREPLKADLIAQRDELLKIYKEIIDVQEQGKTRR